MFKNTILTILVCFCVVCVVCWNVVVSIESISRFGATRFSYIASRPIRWYVTFQPFF